jgi:hypothetical protein
MVLRRGMEKGDIGETPKGGHLFPISIPGTSLKWKNPQKKAKKKKNF